LAAGRASAEVALVVAPTGVEVCPTKEGVAQRAKVEVGMWGATHRFFYILGGPDCHILGSYALFYLTVMSEIVFCPLRGEICTAFR